MPRKPIHTLLRLSLAFVWIWTGLVVLFFSPFEESLALMAPLGLPEQAALVLIWLTAILELVLGALTAANWRVRIWVVMQLILIAGFTVILTWIDPSLWLHPFGAISKNVPLFAATLALYFWESEKEKQRRQLYSFDNEMEP